MLAPLTRITDATRMAATGSLSHRIELEGRQDEFRELADSFDAMLALLEAHIAEQQRFAANASHELRTPLAITQTLLDVARSDQNRDNDELVDRLHAVNTRAIDLTEALLLLSRADQRSFTREHVDLSLIAEEATETLFPLAEKRGLTIETSGRVTPTVGSHALLLQLTTNLVQNAIVHNLPEQGTVWITTSVQPESAVLTVENTGEKLTSQLVATLAEPFLRGSKRIRTDHAGVGLGLAIVKSITQAHDGTLTLTPRAAGGLRVTVQLPAAPPHNGDQGNLIRLPAAQANRSRSQPGSSGQQTFEVVVAHVPAALLTLELAVGGNRAVRHQHRRPAVPLGELELNQLRLIWLFVPDPGEHEPARRLDHLVLAGRAGLGPVGGIAHDDADPAPDPEIDLGRRRLPVGHAMEPAPEYLLARPSLEHLLDRHVEGPLDAQHPRGMLGHPRSSRYSPTTSKSRSQRVC